MLLQEHQIQANLLSIVLLNTFITWGRMGIEAFILDGYDTKLQMQPYKSSIAMELCLKELKAKKMRFVFSKMVKYFMRN